MNPQIANQISTIKSWLGTGSINVFGLPMSGKDTVGMRLAQDLGAKFLSSGIIIRAVEAEENSHMTDNGQLIPTDKFNEIILPYFSRDDLKGYPLVLSSVGRWDGEENAVMEAAKNGGHEIKAVVTLAVSEDDVIERWNTAKTLNDRGLRADDADEKTFQTRIQEFNEKTLPVLMHYHQLGMLLQVKADMSRDEVYFAVVNQIAEFAQKQLDTQAELAAEDAKLANGHNGKRV